MEDELILELMDRITAALERQSDVENAAEIVDIQRNGRTLTVITSQGEARVIRISEA